MQKREHENLIKDLKHNNKTHKLEISYLERNINEKIEDHENLDYKIKEKRDYSDY